MNLLGCYFYSKGRLSSMHCQVFQPEGCAETKYQVQHNRISTTMQVDLDSSFY